MQLKSIQTTDVTNKKVLLRLDLDVPLSDTGEILDTTRLTAGLETVRYLLDHKAEVIICGHLGRPKGESKKEYSLISVAKWYSNNFKFQISNFRLPRIEIRNLKSEIYLIIATVSLHDTAF